MGGQGASAATNPNQQPEQNAANHIDGPDVDLTAPQALLYQGEPFTGEAVEYRKDGSL